MGLFFPIWVHFFSYLCSFFPIWVLFSILVRFFPSGFIFPMWAHFPIWPTLPCGQSPMWFRFSQLWRTPFISYFNFFFKICFKRAVQFFFEREKKFFCKFGIFWDFGISQEIPGYFRKSRDGDPRVWVENPMGFQYPGIGIFFRGMGYPSNLPPLPLGVCCANDTYKAALASNWRKSHL